VKRRDHKLYVEDVLQSMDRIERYTRGQTFERFRRSEMVADAVIRNLEIIGEAARSIPQEVRQRHPDIPWTRMIGLRNIAIHEYFGVDLGIIWEIVRRNLPETRSKIVALLEKPEKDSSPAKRGT